LVLNNFNDNFIDDWTFVKSGFFSMDATSSPRKKMARKNIYLKQRSARKQRKQGTVTSNQ
jgi:hypothetical protein